MLNNCNNSGTIVTRDPSLLIEERSQSYDEWAKYKAITFNKLVPMPEDLNIDSGFFGEGTDRQLAMEKARAANREKYWYPDWYDWSIANWWTKWDAYDGNVDVDDNWDGTFDVRFSFDTAWCPPIEWYDKIIQHESIISIEADFYEPGCDILGYYIWSEWSGCVEFEECPNRYYSDTFYTDVFTKTPSNIYINMNGEEYLLLQEYIDQMQEKISQAEDEDEIESLESERNDVLEYFGETLADPEDDPEKQLEKDLLP